MAGVSALSGATRDELIIELSARCSSLVLGCCYADGPEATTLFHNYGGKVEQIGLCELISRRLDRVAETIAAISMGDDDDEDDQEGDDGDE